MASRGARGGGRNGSRGSGDRNTSQSQSHNNVEGGPSVRGSNVLEQVPNNPSKRKFIEVESDKEFPDQEKVIRDMTCTLKVMFGGPWATWKLVDKDSCDAMWQQFRGCNLAVQMENKRLIFFDMLMLECRDDDGVEGGLIALMEVFIKLWKSIH